MWNKFEAILMQNEFISTVERIWSKYKATLKRIWKPVNELKWIYKIVC